MAVYSLYLPGDRLTLAELSAARLDGEVYDLGEAFVASDAVETPDLRAGSMSEILGTTLAATHLSAAWIRGGASDPPRRPCVQRAVARRIHRIPDARLVYRDGALGPEDLERIGGVLVTTAQRTLVDLARVDDPAHGRAGERLAKRFPDAITAAIAWLDIRGALPHRRRAIAALGRWRDQPDVTR